MTAQGLYMREPLETVDGIPVFAPRDAYMENYEQIARDHLEATDRTGEANPFIEEQDWEALEESTAALLRRHARPGDRVLDVGVGLGRLLGRFSEFQRYGMDVSLDYLRRARGRGLEVCCARAEDMPYPDGFFDVVVSTDVLEHVVDLNASVAAMDRVLRPGGLLVVRVPDGEDLTPYLAPDYPYRLAHVRSFDEASLRLLFTRLFDFDFVASSYAHLASHPKSRVPLHLFSAVVVRALRLVRAAGLRQALYRAFYRPIVVNVVFRKREAAQQSSEQR